MQDAEIPLIGVQLVRLMFSFLISIKYFPGKRTFSCC